MTAQDGNLVATWDDRALLNAPWGIVKAPDTGFGLYSGKLLVSNFGNGTITVFDPATRKAIDYLRTASGAFGCRAISMKARR